MQIQHVSAAYYIFKGIDLVFLSVRQWERLCQAIILWTSQWGRSGVNFSVCKNVITYPNYLAGWFFIGQWEIEACNERLQPRLKKNSSEFYEEALLARGAIYLHIRWLLLVGDPMSSWLLFGVGERNQLCARSWFQVMYQSNPLRPLASAAKSRALSIFTQF